MTFQYIDNEVPSDYCCSICGAHGCKLWRQYQTFPEDIRLLCVDHAIKDQNETFDKDSPTQIGWLVAAVPTEENDTFWGYTSVPEAGMMWWRHLPLRV